MTESTIFFTNRMLNILREAENEASQSEVKVVHPIHLLLACLAEKGGALGEIYLKTDIDFSYLRRSLADSKVVKSAFFAPFSLAILSASSRSCPPKPLPLYSS